MSGMQTTGTNKIAGLKCPQAKQLFSPYLDGAVTGTEMLALQSHFSECAACHREYLALRRTQQLLVNVPRPRVPADLQPANHFDLAAPVRPDATDVSVELCPFSKRGHYTEHG